MRTPRRLTMLDRLAAAGRPRPPLSLVTPGRRVSRGVATVTFSGSSETSAPTTVPHGLEGTPTVQLTSVRSEHTAAYAELDGDPDETSFDVVCVDPLGTPAASTQKVHWRAELE